MITFGLLGAGRIGRVHAANIAAHPKARLAAICDMNAEAAGQIAAQTGAKVCTDPDQIFTDPAIDVVVIATPAETHVALIEAAARAGKAIFCEKPIDKDIQRTARCLKVVEEAGVPLFLAFNRRFDPSFAALQRRLAAGEIGAAELVVLTSRDPAPPPLDYIARSGGLFRDMMIHDFDVARWLLAEEVVEVFAVGHCFAEPRIAEFGYVDTGVVTLTAKSGAIAVINNVMRAAYGYDQRVEVHGAEGMLQLGNRFDTSVVAHGGKGIATELPKSFFTERYADAYVLELTHFIDALERGDRPRPDGRDGLAALALAEAAQRSYEQGRPVRVADVLP